MVLHPVAAAAAVAAAVAAAWKAVYFLSTCVTSGEEMIRAVQYIKSLGNRLGMLLEVG